MTSRPASLTTSTVYTTSTYTITSCAPSVTDCAKGRVVTETIPLYTTVCPVAETALPAKPTTTGGTAARTTSTVYTTKTYTITSCAPYVTNCPVGKVTTEVMAAYTTVCPVEGTEAGKVPQPTAASGSGDVAAPQTTRTTTATMTVYRTVKLNVTPSAETSVGSSTAVAPKPSSGGCSGLGCAGGATVSTSSWAWTTSAASASSNSTGGCPGSGCSGVAVPTGSWTSYAGGPSTTPSYVSGAGACTRAFGLTGLIAVIAAALLVM